MKYIPKQPNTTDSIIYDSLGDYSYSNGEPYYGKYHFKNGIPYTGLPSDINSFKLYTQKLFDDKVYNEYYFKLNKKKFDKYTPPIAYIPIIRIKDYVTSYINRYFVKQRNSLLPIIEINDKQYNTLATRYSGIDENLYDGIMLQWKIYGPKNDILDNKGMIIEYGIIDTNFRTLNLKEKEMPGIKKALPNLMQFGRASK